MTLPDWLDPLPDAEQQRGLDRWAIEELGMPGLELMERAGAGLAEVVQRRAPVGEIVVVVGKGNNGGDGLVCARLLRRLGRAARVLLIGSGDELQGDARTNYDRLGGEAPERFDPLALSGASAVVDAILGTGFSGEAREPAAGAIEAINASGARVVVACDVPSGVDASTGEVHGVAVRANATVTFHAAKPGLWIAPGKGYAGEVEVVDIGIPAGGPADPQIGLIAARVTHGVPRRGRESTKFAAGSVLVCGGSLGLTGAPSMASEAFVPASLNLIFETRLLEPMTIPLADDGGSLTPAGADAVLEHVKRADALVLGPGIGRTDGAFELARRLAGEAAIPMLLDADGLNAHAGRLQSLTERSAPAVLTPHAGELARLLETDSGAIEARRLESVRAAASTARAIVVLKGDDTLIAHPDGRVAVSRGGAPALATAGSGDVLSGVTGAYLSKRMDPFQAACAAVLVHAEAGRLAAQRIGPEGVIAGDVIESLPQALAAALR
jgi:NAD(P)H-hydrate epimerase